jgi:hypothetical protein
MAWLEYPFRRTVRNIMSAYASKGPPSTGAVLLLRVILSVLPPAACGLAFAAPAEPPINILRTPDADRAASYEFTPADDAFLDQIQRGCFNYLWNEVGRPSGLAKDRRTTVVASTAGVGFQLSALPIGIERGWITRDEGRRRALSILRTLLERTDNRRDGVFLHFVHADTGAIYPPYHNEVSTVDHTLLLAGALPAAVYFGGEVGELVGRMAAETNWKKYYNPQVEFISFAWKPVDHGNLAGDGAFSPHAWHVASDEERLVYFIAAGCPTDEFAADPRDYYRLERHVRRHADGPPFVVSPTGSPFTYFFSHCWIDYRALRADDPRRLGVEALRVDWFENSRRAVLTHRQRCIEAANEFPTLGPDRWGLSPCMGFDDKGQMNYLVPDLRPSLFDRDQWQGGTIAPYAAGSAIMFAPEESLAALRAFRDLEDHEGRPLVWRDPADGGYAFADSFRLDPPRACDDNVAIDVGPMLLAIENARTGLIWRLFMEHDVARRAVGRLKLSSAP